MANANTNENRTYIEYSLVGTMLDYPDEIGEAVAKISPIHFANEVVRAVYKAISDCYFLNILPDTATVKQKLGEDYFIMVDELREKYSLLTSTQLSNYCDLLLDAYILDKLKNESNIMYCAPTIDVALAALDAMNAITVSQQKVSIVSAAQATLDFHIRQGTGEKPEYLTWGMDELNKCMYTQLGDFIVIGGYPSAGKTLLSIQFALEMAQKYSVGYFSLETSTSKLVDRMISYLAQLPLSKIKTQNLTEADWAGIAEAADKLNKMQLDCIDAAGMTVRDIQATALNKHYQVIFVDYLQLVTDRGKNRYEQVTNISQGLHTLARSQNIAVIALAQLSRPEKNNGKPQPPSMSSFRESGQIEQDADVAILLWPSDPNDNRSNRILKVAKNKEGERAKIELEFDGARQTLKPVEPTQGEKYNALHKAIREAGRVENNQVEFTELTGVDKNLPF